MGKQKLNTEYILFSNDIDIFGAVFFKLIRGVIFLFFELS